MRPSLLLAFAAAALSCRTRSSSGERAGRPSGVRDSASLVAQAQWVSYEPRVVRLEGQLLNALKYGPPNYGEDTATDEKVHVPILILDHPINVLGDSTSEVNADSFHGVKEIQLVFAKSAGDHEHLWNQTVIVTGTLSEAETGHHFTDVWMQVNAIRPGTH